MKDAPTKLRTAVSARRRTAFQASRPGKEEVNATLPVSVVMVRALRDFRERVGVDIGFKPAGGLRSAKDALAWLILMKEELGLPWMQPDLFRIVSSGLLTDIERQLEHYATGRYSAAYRHPACALHST